jgi:isocitrate dehydrogenase kinase/phosphatase
VLTTFPVPCRRASTRITVCFVAPAPSQKSSREAADWHGQQRAPAQRIELYDLRVAETAQGLTRDCSASDLPMDLWHEVKLHDIGLLVNHHKLECDETFFNSGTARMSPQVYRPSDHIFCVARDVHRVLRKRRASHSAHLPRQSLGARNPLRGTQTQHRQPPNHLCHSGDSFRIAPGIKGAVMLVAYLPSFPLGLKLIRVPCRLNVRRVPLPPNEEDEMSGEGWQGRKARASRPGMCMRCSPAIPTGTSVLNSLPERDQGACMRWLTFTSTAGAQ